MVFECLNRCGKVKPKGSVKVEEGETLCLATGGKFMHDTLYSLQATLQKLKDDRDTNLQLHKPHFKGGKNA